MNGISKIIIEARKAKGLSQEALSELANVNLRTIQRIENNENQTRGKTLNLVCDALEIPFENLQYQDKNKKLNSFEFALNIFFLIILNLSFISIIGFLTLDSEANLNSKIGALFLSFFIPFFITYKTQKSSRTTRVIKYGSGIIVYLLVSAILIGIPIGFVSGLLPCLLLSLTTLFYGEIFLNKNN